LGLVQDKQIFQLGGLRDLMVRSSEPVQVLPTSPRLKPLGLLLQKRGVRHQLGEREIQTTLSLVLVLPEVVLMIVNLRRLPISFGFQSWGLLLATLSRESTQIPLLEPIAQAAHPNPATRVKVITLRVRETKMGDSALPCVESMRG